VHAVIKRLIQKREEEGFTLIELLIVIIVLGILAAIIVFAVLPAQKTAASGSCKTDAKSIELSLEAQNTRNGTYPANPAAAIDPAQGALLKAWPVNPHYAFAYAFTAGSPSGYSVAISSGDGSVKGGTWDNGATGDAAIQTACAAL
jgi:general secretion pathway protein G